MGQMKMKEKQVRLGSGDKDGKDVSNCSKYS